jgi:hypothetical protein
MRGVVATRSLAFLGRFNAGRASSTARTHQAASRTPKPNPAARRRASWRAWRGRSRCATRARPAQGWSRCSGWAPTAGRRRCRCITTPCAEPHLWCLLPVVCPVLQLYGQHVLPWLTLSRGAHRYCKVPVSAAMPGRHPTGVVNKHFRPRTVTAQRGLPLGCKQGCPRMPEDSGSIRAIAEAASTPPQTPPPRTGHGSGQHSTQNPVSWASAWGALSHGPVIPFSISQPRHFLSTKAPQALACARGPRLPLPRSVLLYRMLARNQGAVVRNWGRRVAGWPAARLRSGPGPAARTRRAAQKEN